MKYMTNLVLVSVLFVSLFANEANAEGSAVEGAKKAAICAACHGPTGISINLLWPNLAGQQPLYLANQIKAFRDGDRAEPTMAPFVMNLSDQDAEDLAAHFASLKACP